MGTEPGKATATETNIRLSSLTTELFFFKYFYNSELKNK